MTGARIAVLVSGGGTNLQALIDAQRTGILCSGSIVLVISSSEDAYALRRAEHFGIETAVISRAQCTAADAFDRALIRRLDEAEIDLIVLAGFMCILGKDFTAHYPNRIINVHPSLIPAFCGKGFYGLRVHEAALAYGVKVTGATVHFVNEIPDGGRIIAQKAVEILPGDTAEILQKRVMEQAEWVLLPRAAELVCRELNEKEHPHGQL